MVSQLGRNWKSTENCFLTTYHSSFTLDSGRFFVACPGLGFRVLVRWLVVARVLRRHFRATRRLQSFAVIDSLEVADLVTLCCGLSRYHFGNLVCCDLFLLPSQSCFLFFTFLFEVLFLFLCGVFSELTVFRVFLRFGLGRHKNYFLIGFLSIRFQ